MSLLSWNTLRCRPTWAFPTLIVACAMLAGCRSLHDEPKANYQTVQANPSRDTERAIAEHDKALKILDHCGRDYCCNCVQNVACNPCKAEQHLQQALIADVRFGPAHNTLGTYYLNQGKLYLAAWEFEYASRLMPERPEPLNNLGLVYEGAGKLGLAISSYEEAVDLKPTSGEYLGNLARAHLKQGTPFEEVRHVLQQVVFYDSRPRWVDWARDQLGRHPLGRGEMVLAGFETTEPDSVENTAGTPEPLPPPPGKPIDKTHFPTLVNPAADTSLGL